jgi:hypothetical protein
MDVNRFCLSKNKRMFRIFAFFSLILTIWLACACDRSKNSENAQIEADSLQTQLITLNDSVNRAWEQLVASDQLREQSLKDLLEQIAGMRSYNKPLHDSLVNEQAELSRLRYTSPATLSSAIIDTYDAKSDKVKNGVYRLGNATPEYAACALCGELREKIEQADNQTLFNRINYDRQAQAYNEFIKTYASDLTQIRPAYSNLSPLPLFQIPM